MLKFFVFLLIYKSKQHYLSTQTNKQTHYKQIFVMLKKAKKVKILLEFDFFKLIFEKSFSDQKYVSSVCTTNYVVDFLLKIRKKAYYMYVTYPKITHNKIAAYFLASF